jgi:hypothetical protein
MRSLLDLLDELEQDRLLEVPDRLRPRIEVLDLLDAYLLDGKLPAPGNTSVEAGTLRRASALYTRLEAANSELYQAIRSEVQKGDGRDRFLEWLPDRNGHGDNLGLANGQSYDYLDELLSGVLEFQAPGARVVELAPEMVAYQPTPARHIFDLISRTALTERDVLVDLGSGLGHVPLLASICTKASCIGIELEKVYVDSARLAAEKLNLANVTFIQQDARAADLSRGTVFYLYTPFSGSILRAVLDLLRHEAAKREIRVCTFGLCTLTIAKEPWLRSLDPSDENRIGVFCGKDR